MPRFFTRGASSSSITGETARGTREHLFTTQSPQLPTQLAFARGGGSSFVLVACCCPPDSLCLYLAAGVALLLVVRCSSSTYFFLGLLAFRRWLLLPAAPPPKLPLWFVFRGCRRPVTHFLLCSLCLLLSARLLVLPRRLSPPAALPPPPLVYDSLVLSPCRSFSPVLSVPSYFCVPVCQLLVGATALCCPPPPPPHSLCFAGVVFLRRSFSLLQSLLFVSARLLALVRRLWLPAAAAPPPPLVCVWCLVLSGVAALCRPAWCTEVWRCCVLRCVVRCAVSRVV